MRAPIKNVTIGTRRNRRMFLFFPWSLMNPDTGQVERRWLEFAHVVEEYQESEDFTDGGTWRAWMPLAWGSEEVEAL